MKTNTICLLSVFLASQLLYGCSFARLTVTASMPMIEGGFIALNRETDLILAEAAMPANIELIEGMLINAPDNIKLRLYASQAYYGYSYGFVEDNNKVRASNLYYRGFKHGISALKYHGLNEDLLTLPLDSLQSFVSNLDNNATASLFWTASCLAKWVDMNRDKPESIAQMSRANILMQRVLELDENFFMGGAKLFFAVYYGSKPPILGGDYQKSEHYFSMARSFNSDKLLLVDLLQAQYLDRQLLNRKQFITRLNKILETPDNIYPDQSLLNMIAKRKATLFLKKESTWF
ncbi:MAG: TRAP transporter TatT component family protein [Gammaproteobacteria bacterium]|nr:TRAP transporter TatT component family protein [Gammaproteobacteria bacterium]